MPSGPGRHAAVDDGSVLVDDDAPTITTDPAPVGRRVSAVRGGIWSALSQLLPALGTAVLSVAAGRYLGAGPLGQQSLIAYVNSALGAVVVYGLTQAALQSAGTLEGQHDTRRQAALERWAIGSHLGTGVVVLAVVASIGELSGKDRSSWLLIGVISVLDAVIDGMSVRMIMREGWAPIGRLRLYFQMIGPPLGIAFLFLGQGIFGIFLGDGIAALGLLVAVAVRYRRVSARYVPDVLDAGWSARPPAPILRPYLLFAVGQVINQVVTKRVEFVVLAVFATDVAIGQYSVAFMAPSLLALIPLGIAGAAMPMVAAAQERGELDRATYHLRLALRLGTAISIPLVAMLASLGPAAVTLVYGARYEQAARLVPVASLALLVAVIAGVCTPFWSGLNRLGVVLGTGALAGAVDIAVALAAIPFLSAWGAVLSNLAGQVALAAALLYATHRRTGPVGWRPDTLARWVIASGLGALAASAVRLGLVQALPGHAELRDAATLVLGGVLGVLVIVLAGRAIRLLAPDEAEWLRPVLPQRLYRYVERFTV